VGARIRYDKGILHPHQSDVAEVHIANHLLKVGVKTVHAWLSVSFEIAHKPNCWSRARLSMLIDRHRASTRLRLNGSVVPRLEQYKRHCCSQVSDDGQDQRVAGAG
jgi:hypothetical protein